MELKEKINRMINALQFYDKYRFFPFDKVRVDLTISRENAIKLKEVPNKSEFVDNLITKSFF